MECASLTPKKENLLSKSETHEKNLPIVTLEKEQFNKWILQKLPEKEALLSRLPEKERVCYLKHPAIIIAS